MSGAYDAEEMMKRGLFSSIMGFKKKSRSNSLLQNQPSAHQVPRQVLQPQSRDERSQSDIFKEIVCEAQRIEVSTTVAPDSEYVPILDHPETVSAAMSPIMNLRTPSVTPSTTSITNSESLTCPPSPSTYSPMQESPMSPQTMYGLYAPSPNYPNQYLPSAYIDPFAISPFCPPPYSQSPIQYQNNMILQPQIEKDNTVLLEDVVKMVVSAMRTSSLSETGKENPEETLRRKRQQNNEAAARYRKRLREAREKDQTEMNILAKRNEELRESVERMEREIHSLKTFVLRTEQ